MCFLFFVFCECISQPSTISLSKHFHNVFSLRKTKDFSVAVYLLSSHCTPLPIAHCCTCHSSLVSTSTHLTMSQLTSPYQTYILHSISFYVTSTCCTFPHTLSKSLSHVTSLYRICLYSLSYIISLYY